jgi:hypothetical protein
MKFDVQKAVDYIVDEKNPTRHRAIELFAFLVALHVGRSLVKVSGTKAVKSQIESKLVLNVPKKQLRAARMLAAMKMLDQLETSWARENDGKKPTLRRMSKIEEYEEIFNQIILKSGSWYRIRHLQSIRDLEEELVELRRRARSVARIIEFSCRFVPNSNKPKQLGGVTMATDIVTSVPYFQLEVKDSTLERWWSDQQSAAPFFYLIYIQKYPFFLNKIVGKNFAQRFVARVEDRTKLLEFFSAYNSVVQRLSERGYKYAPLRLPDLSVALSLRCDPFRNASIEEREVLNAIDDYRK